MRTGASVERYQERQTGVLALTDAKLGRIEKLAGYLAKSTLVPKQFREADNDNAKWDLINVGITLEQLGVPFNQQTLNQVWVMDGKVNLMAQVTIAVAKSRGYDCWFEQGHVSELDATISVRRRGSDRVDRYTYTLDMARKAGLLNEWAEKWETASSGKRYAKKVTVAVDGTRVAGYAALPDWARKAYESGEAKRKDPWFNAREQMLMARASTLALRIAAPEALLGLPDVAAEDAVPVEYEGRPPGVDENGEVVDRPAYAATTNGTGPVAAAAAGDDDEIVDAEVVDAEPPEPAAAEEAAEQASAPEQQATLDQVDRDGDLDLVDDEWVQRFAMACNGIFPRDAPEGLTQDDFRHAIVFHATNGRGASAKEIRRDEVPALNRTFIDVRDGVKEVAKVGLEWLVVDVPVEDGEPF